jgi:hypothetical protein
LSLMRSRAATLRIYSRELRAEAQSLLSRSQGLRRRLGNPRA